MKIVAKKRVIFKPGNEKIEFDSRLRRHNVHNRRNMMFSSTFFTFLLLLLLLHLFDSFTPSLSLGKKSFFSFSERILFCSIERDVGAFV